jgi:hemoglobin
MGRRTAGSPATASSTNADRPASLHLQVEAGYFDCWLALFEQTAAEICAPPAAARSSNARRIADSIEMGLATKRGEITAPRHGRPTS